MSIPLVPSLKAWYDLPGIKTMASILDGADNNTGTEKYIKLITKLAQYNPDTDKFNYPVSTKMLEVIKNQLFDNKGNVNLEVGNKIATIILNKLGIGDMDEKEPLARLSSLFEPEWRGSFRNHFLRGIETDRVGLVDAYIKRRYKFAYDTTINAIQNKINTYSNDPTISDYDRQYIINYLKTLKYNINQMTEEDYFKRSRFLSPKEMEQAQKLLKTNPKFKDQMLDLELEKKFGKIEHINKQATITTNTSTDNPFNRTQKAPQSTDLVKVIIYIIIAIIVAYIVYRIVKWLYRWYKKRKAQKANKLESYCYNYSRLLNLCEADETHQIGSIYNSYMNQVISFLKKVFGSIEFIMKHIYNLLSLESVKLYQKFTSMFNKHKSIEELKKDYTDVCNNIKQYSSSVYLKDKLDGITNILPKV